MSKTTTLQKEAFYYFPVKKIRRERPLCPLCYSTHNEGPLRNDESNIMSLYKVIL